MAKSGSFSESWWSSTWSGRSKKYNWTGDWERDGNTIKLTSMKLWMTTPGSTSWGTGTDSVKTTGGDWNSYSMTFNNSDTSTKASLSSSSFSVSATTTSATIYCYIDGEVTGSSYITFDANYTKPTGVSGTNLTPTGADGVAKTRVDVTTWGTNSSSKYWTANKSNSEYTPPSTQIWAYSNVTNELEWAGLNASIDKTTGTITTWYPQAINNHDLITVGSAKYIVSPSSPSVTVIGGTTNSPSLRVTGSVSYSGGETNSSTTNTAAIKSWSLHYKKTTDTSTTEKDRSVTTNRTYNSASILATDFELGANYIIETRVTNEFGAYGSTNKTVYCPTGVTGRVSTNAPDYMEITASSTYSGGITSTATNTSAYYKVKWSTDPEVIGRGGGTETEAFSSTVTIPNLTPGTEYFYRVYGWNTYGLSQVSGTLSNTTIPRYSPKATDLEITPSSTGVGGKVKVTISKTGGLSEDAERVRTLTVYGRPAGVSSWRVIGTPVTGRSLRSGQSYTFNPAWASVFDEPGDWEIKVLMSNGTDQGFSPTTLLKAPTTITAVAVPPESGSLVQISVSAKTTSETAIHEWQITYAKDIAGATIKTLATESSDEEIVLSTDNHLDYNTTYRIVVKATNTYGLWRESAPIVSKTQSRVNWYAVINGEEKRVTPSFLNATVGNKNITEVYFIVKNSLGNKEIGDDLRNMKLTFIQEMLSYRPENIASIEFSNGKTLAYDYDEEEDVYKFGIWADGQIELTFHNGYNWEKGYYNIPNEAGYDIVGIAQPIDIGLNASAAFSTTSCTEKPLWETE